MAYKNNKKKLEQFVKKNPNLYIGEDGKVHIKPNFEVSSDCTACKKKDK